MSAEYRFLRFEVVGIATVIFFTIGILPILDRIFLLSLISDTSAILAVVASLFLVSLPIGYAEHQVVVNVYRSHKMERATFSILRDIIVEAERSCKSEKGERFFESMDDFRKNSFLTSLLDFCIYYRDSMADPTVFGRLSDRWSHFYARRAVGRYAPIFSLLLWMVAVILGYIFSWPIVFELPKFILSIVWWAIIFILCNRVIDVYANKIMLEICFLETSIVLANKKRIEKTITEIICSLVEHPEYIEKGEKYGAAIYRL